MTLTPAIAQKIIRRQLRKVKRESMTCRPDGETRIIQTIRKMNRKEKSK